MRPVAVLSCLTFTMVGLLGDLHSAEQPLSVPRQQSVTPPTPAGNENIAQSLQKEALHDLIKNITAKKQEKKLRLIGIVGAVQDSRATALLEQAFDESQQEGIKCKIVESIGKLHDPASLGWLGRRLEDPHSSIQCFALWALGELKTPRAARFIRPKLWSPDVYVQMTAIDALGKTGRDSATAVELATFLNDEDAQIRYLSAKSLEGTADASLSPLIAERLMQEPSLEVQEALARTLGHAGGSIGVGRLIEVLKYPPSQATEYLAQAGLKAADPAVIIPAIAPLLNGNDFRLKVAASHILAELERPEPEEGRTSWLEQVMRWAQGPDLISRQAAQRLLERMKSPS